MGDYHVRFRERFRGETPLYLLDEWPLINQHSGILFFARHVFPHLDYSMTSVSRSLSVKAHLKPNGLAVWLVGVRVEVPHFFASPGKWTGVVWSR